MSSNNMTNLYNSPQNEYWFHVSDQNEIPIAGLTTKSFNIVLFLKHLASLPEDERVFEKYLFDTMQNDIDYLDILRTLIGVSDKRMYLELSYLFSKTKVNIDDNTSICGCTVYNLNKHPLSFFKNLTKSRDPLVAKKSIILITQYLNRKGLFPIMSALRKSSEPELKSIVDNLILTKELQQEEAKRRGHGAEFELAKILHSFGCRLIPEERFERAMTTKDPNVNKVTFKLAKKIKSTTWSFDMIIPIEDVPFIFIQSLIHTSDPGQYGVNKSDETVQIKESLSQHNKKNNFKKELWGLVDGVGFSENKKDTIDKMLTEFDSFIQLKTLYKAALKLHKIGQLKVKGIRFDKNFYSNKNDISDMYRKYANSDIKLINSEEEGLSIGREVVAGKAWVYI